MPNRCGPTTSQGAPGTPPSTPPSTPPRRSCRCRGRPGWRREHRPRQPGTGRDGPRRPGPRSRRSARTPSGPVSMLITSVPSSTRAVGSDRSCASRTRSRWSCGTHAGGTGPTTALCSVLGYPTSNELPVGHLRHRLGDPQPPLDLDAAGGQRILEPPGPQQLHRPGADHRRPGQPEHVLPSLHQQHLDPEPGQRPGRRQARRPGPHHEHRDAGPPCSVTTVSLRHIIGHAVFRQTTCL